MRSKILSIVLILSMLIGMCAGGAPAEPAALPVHVEGAIFGGEAGGSVPVELRFDAEWLTAGDNTCYNADLAAFSALLCADSYFRAKDVERSAQNRVLIDGVGAEEYDTTQLMRRLGCSDARYVESFKLKSYDTDGNDSATMTMGYLCAEDVYDVYLIALRGAFSIQERISAFDPGFDGESYAAYTGEHPEWIDRRNFKGNDIGARRAMEFIRAFIDEHDDPERENCVLVTGHSRGAALANIIGAALEQDAGIRAFTYAFNAMPVTTDPAAAACTTVFNIFDRGDYYCDPLPFGEETFYRCGTELSADIAASEEIRAAIAELKGRDDYLCVGAEAMAEYRAMFGRRFPSREALYEAVTLSESFATETEAVERMEACRTLAGAEAGLALEPFCTVGDVHENADGSFGFDMDYCGEALILGYCRILAYGSAAGDAFQTLFAGDEAGCRIAEFITAHLNEITGGHLLANDYAMAGFVGAES